MTIYGRQFDAITELEATGLIGRLETVALIDRARSQRDAHLTAEERTWAAREGADPDEVEAIVRGVTEAGPDPEAPEGGPHYTPRERRNA